MQKSSSQIDITSPPLPKAKYPFQQWGQLYGSSRGLAISGAREKFQGLLLLITPDMQSATQLESELRFFGKGNDEAIAVFPDWETLPYDVFSPHEDIISQRLETLYRLPTLKDAVLIVPVTTLMQRLAPRAYLLAHSLMLDSGQKIDRDEMLTHLGQAGYDHVSQVMSHGEVAVRGSIIDLFPMGSRVPYRLDLFDDEIESIRIIDIEKQTSTQTVDNIRLLPAREFPTHEQSIKLFRQQYRQCFEGDPSASLIYREVSNNRMPSGIEYYLPLFFETTETLFDYLPEETLVIHTDCLHSAAESLEQDTAERYEQRRHDNERPLLEPSRLFLSSDEIQQQLEKRKHIEIQRTKLQATEDLQHINFPTQALPVLSYQARAADPAQNLRTFLDNQHARILFVAESAGRREYLTDVLKAMQLRPQNVDSWQSFIQVDAPVCITVSPIVQGLRLLTPDVVVITEHQLFGERVQQRRRRKVATRDAEGVIRNLTDLSEDAPVVHEEHGVGRYLGLQRLTIGDIEAEFLTLEYSGGDKLYVPVASLHLVSRYTGSSTEHAPLHKLGGDQWQRIKRKAAARARDVAAELLEIHARRAARKGHSFDTDNDEYAAFASSFPFEETLDQERAIGEVLADMAATQPMDRVVCGDVGFGKTEVAMRSAFVAVQNGKQVVVLVPTTLLAQQHYQNFLDRFADWPVRIASLSRFRSQKQQKEILEEMKNGKVDIVIGTHKLLQPSIAFKNLGLVIVDEEQRFGVRHKEKLKALRADVDLLTLTATPIPRTLNMSLSGLRDLSIIATPPDHRLAIKTFVSQWNDALIQEACQREIKRGGQVYFLHNEVETIEKTKNEIERLLPDARVQFAHGQMRERDLEQVMLDFYHQRFNVLVCSTIIESGIDIPSANTIIINRADKLGLAQLHQLRGRVGRSHHRAYAYLIAPPKGVITADATKRLEAIESLEDLGVGFTLATHDLEIRGAGELLGEDQSGQIHEIGFSLYNELLERAVKALKAGQIPDLDTQHSHGAEVDLGLPALIPDDYVYDVHTRLILYKRIASATSIQELDELKVEMIDRFGLLPEYTNNLFEATQLKLHVMRAGIVKVEVSDQGGRILFDKTPEIDPQQLVRLLQNQPDVYKLDGQEKLRFTLPMNDLEDRVNTICDLVDNLTLKKAA